MESCRNYPYKDETGKKYGHLTVLAKTEMRVPSNGCVVWKCICDCGKICYINGNNLRRGVSQTCGCSHYKKSGSDV